MVYDLYKKIYEKQAAFYRAHPAAKKALEIGNHALTAAVFVKKIHCISPVGVSAAAAAVHNTVQLTAASILFGAGVWYYLPLLLAAAAVSGTAMGALCLLILKKWRQTGLYSV